MSEEQVSLAMVNQELLGVFVHGQYENDAYLFVY